jgi:hypothetical protein
VVLPVVNILDGALPVSMISPLMDLLQGYYIFRQVYDVVQGAAFEAEEELDWAIDWSRDDNEIARCSGYPTRSGLISQVDGAEGSGFPLAKGYPARSVANGRAAERASVTSGKMRIGRRTRAGRLDTSHTHPGMGRRYYDGVDPGNGRLMIEVKIGSQDVTHRIRRQIDIDMHLSRSQQRDVKWILYERRGQPVNPALIAELQNRGIKYEILGLVQ